MKKFAVVSPWTALILLFALSASAAAQTILGSTTLHVSVADAKGAPISGAAVELRSNEKILAQTTTDAKGESSLTAPAGGGFTLVVRKAGYVEESYLAEVGKAVETELAFALTAVNVQQTVDVKASADNPVTESSSAAPRVALPPTAAKESAGKPATLKDALPLIPGIVRGSDGTVRIAGYGETHSALLVNGVDVTDPSTGNFGLSIPIDSVDEINVSEMPYLAQYGRFTAGVVTAETRRGGEKWDFNLNDPLPEFRIRSWHLQGLKTATPRLNLSGPLVKNKLYFLEGAEYTMYKHSARTLPFPQNQWTEESINSFSQIDWVINGKQTLSGSFHIAPHRAKHSGLNYFNPIPTTPNADMHEYTGAIIHRWQIGEGLLTTTVAKTQHNSSTAPIGASLMTLSPLQNSGNYFSTAWRDASRLQWKEDFSLAPMRWLIGVHHLQIGSLLSHAEATGQFKASSVLIRDAKGQLARRIDFSGGSRYSLDDTAPAGYAQDHWQINDHFAFDSGIRFESQTITHTVRFAPRAGFIWAPDKQQRTRLRGGAGVFYDAVPLNMYAFAFYPEQTITDYDANGNVVKSTSYANLTEQSAGKFPFVSAKKVSGNFSPYSLAWNLELEHVFSRQLTMRAKLLASSAQSILKIDEQTVAGSPAFVLNSGGSAHTRQFELVAQIGASSKRRLYASYVWQHARGVIGDATSYLGDVSFPVLRQSSNRALPSDIPHRFLAWGVYVLPYKFRVSPKFEWRTGFAYQSVDALQQYVSGEPTRRFPNYLSADVRISRDFQVTKKHAIRLSTTIANITNHFNALEVHSNIADPNYGLFFGNYNRKYTLDFDFLF